MYPLRLLYGFAFTMLLASCAVAQSATDDTNANKIPLKQIWAYQMPGTRDVRELEPKLDVHDPSFRELYRRSVVRKIARFLATYVPDRGKWAPPAFVVVGTGKEALENAYSVFNAKQMGDQIDPFPKDTELSLVFYTYATGWHPKINSVEQTSDLITVKYQFIAQQEPVLGAVRFALIPIGKLPEGIVQVEIEQVPPVDYKGRPVGPKREAERFVCNSSSFVVR